VPPVVTYDADTKMVEVIVNQNAITGPDVIIVPVLITSDPEPVAPVAPVAAPVAAPVVVDADPIV